MGQRSRFKQVKMAKYFGIFKVFLAVSGKSDYS